MSHARVRRAWADSLNDRLELDDDEMKTVGYLADAFDLFHVGHLGVLSHARDRCDFPIVGVATDESARQSRGIKPAIPFAERFEIVRSVRFVDSAAADTGADRLDAWRDLHFRRLFIGHDWSGPRATQTLKSRQDQRPQVMKIDFQFAAESERIDDEVDAILRVLHAPTQTSTPKHEIRLDRLVARSLDLDEHEALSLEQLAGGTHVGATRTPAHFLTVLKQAIAELGLSRLFCSSSQGEFHRGICPAAYDERSGEHHPAEMAEWRATFRAMAPEQQMMTATIVWMYRPGAASIWLRRVPCTWRASEALRYMHDAGCLTIWIRLIARFPGW